jgi:serine/threonine protein phosphatase PrpC
MSETVPELAEPQQASPTPAAPVRHCPVCGDEADQEDNFCQSCGEDLRAPGEERPAAAEAPEQAAPSACRECGGVVAADGYCERCGARAPNPRDHWSQEIAPWLGAVTDKGRRHQRNEDAMALTGEPRAGGRAVLVVCDGVSTAPDSDRASLAAATAACEVLTEPAPVDGLEDRMQAAATAARDAVVATTPARTGPNPPSCTFVAGVVDGNVLVTASIGDSRAYWLPDAGEARQVSTDDSWLAEAVAMGMSPADAERSPQAHAITRWLGVDGPEPTPHTTRVDLDGPGWVVVCSDGLWNYCSPAKDLADLVHGVAQAGDGRPVAVADALVAWANEQGGHDNITVVLARIG